MFRHHRSNTPNVVSDTAHLMPRVKEAIKRYLRGIGHPHQARDFCDPKTYDSENSDPSLRARRFVKVLSGLDMMPVNESKKFMVFSSFSALRWRFTQLFV
jgi:hypothetical protein